MNYWVLIFTHNSLVPGVGCNLQSQSVRITEGFSAVDSDGVTLLFMGMWSTQHLLLLYFVVLHRERVCHRRKVCASSVVAAWRLQTKMAAWSETTNARCLGRGRTAVVKELSVCVGYQCKKFWKFKLLIKKKRETLTWIFLDSKLGKVFVHIITLNFITGLFWLAVYMGCALVFHCIPFLNRLSMHIDSDSTLVAFAFQQYRRKKTWPHLCNFSRGCIHRGI